MRRCVLAFVLFVLPLGVPNCATGQKQTEEEKLHGTWISTSFEVKGKTFPAPAGGSMTFSKDGKVMMKEKGKLGKEIGFKIDATKNPKHLDLINPEEKDKDKQVAPAIYKLEADTLTLAIPLPGKETMRPTAFDSKEAAIITLKRQNP